MDYTVHMGGFGQMFGVPNAVVDQYLKLSTPSQLKVLLYLLRHNGQQVEQSEISEALSVSEELVEEALLFWSQTDLFAPGEAPAETQRQAETSRVHPAAEPKGAKRHAGSLATLSNAKSGELSPLEIAAALEKSEDLKTLFRLSEQQLGRPLRHIEQKALVWMHDYNNIGSDIILTVLLYCKSIDKPSVSYAESMITNWWNEGIQTLPQVNAAINEVEHRRSFTGHIQKAFEMNRKPTPKQQEFIDLWQDRQIPMELITYAYEKTLESTDKLAFPYLNAVLMRWMDAGYRTRTDVDTKDKPSAGDSKKQGNAKPAIPESDNAQAYKSFVYNIDS